MIDALVAGRIYGKPQSRTAKNGNTFATATVRVVTRDGEAHFVNVICFAAAAVAALLAMADGDTLALSGELTVKVYAAKDGTARTQCDLLAHQCLSVYHVQRRRQAIAGGADA